MSFNEKIARIGQDIIDGLTIKGFAVAASYDTNQDLYLTMTDPTAGGVNLLIKLMKEAQLGNNQANPVTGLVEEVFTPHRILLGFASATSAQATATMLAAIIPGDKITINGHDITSVVGPIPGADQFIIAGTASSATATLLSTLAAGDKISLRGIDFLCVEPTLPPTGNQWGIIGTKAATTITLTAVANLDTVTIDGIVFQATAATQDNTHFINDASMIVAATNFCTAINANPTTSAVMLATNAGGTSATVTLTALATGTAANAYGTVDGGSGHFVCANATLIGGTVNLTSSAAALAAAVNGSASPSITGFITASPALAVVTVSSVAKGVLGGTYSFTQTGGHITVTGGGFLVAGVADLNATAANLAAAVNASTTVGIINVVRATALAGSPVATIIAQYPGTGGNAITFTQTGGHITVTGGGFLAGGNNTGTGPLPILYALSETLIRGTQVEIYAKTTTFAITDFVAANLVAVFRNNQWGYLAHI